MKISITKERLKFYAWIGLAYLLLWLLVDLVSNPDTFFARAVNELWKALYLFVLNFILLEYTLPFIKLRWNRIMLGIFFLWVHIVLYAYGLYGWRGLGIQLHIYTPFKTYTDQSHGVSEQFGESLFSVLFFGIIKHAYGHIKLKQAAQQLRIEKQAAELNYLRAQTNPHFLFNTLNNIYSLARDKNDLAPESILRLSKILRFMLYETSGAYIAIEDELRIIGDYIALEKLRYDTSLRVNFNYDVEDMKQALPPLLLIPLVENAFKHGVSETREHPFIDIHLSVNNRQLSFFVKNSTEMLVGQVKENIGLSNLRRQLELLYTDYSLSVQQNNTVFSATLKINLASHV